MSTVHARRSKCDALDEWLQPSDSVKFEPDAQRRSFTAYNESREGLMVDEESASYTQDIQIGELWKHGHLELRQIQSIKDKSEGRMVVPGITGIRCGEGQVLM